jgi:hypothetical protein
MNKLFSFNEDNFVNSIESTKIENDTISFTIFDAEKKLYYKQNKVRFHLSIDSLNNIHFKSNQLKNYNELQFIRSLRRQQFNSISPFYFSILKHDQNNFEIIFENRKLNNLHFEHFDSIITLQSHSNMTGPHYYEKWIFKPNDSIIHLADLSYYKESTKTTARENYTHKYENKSWGEFENFIKDQNIPIGLNENNCWASHSTFRKIIVYYNSGEKFEINYNDCKMKSEIPPEILSLFPNSYLNR